MGKKGYEFIGASTVIWIFRLIVLTIIFAVVFLIGSSLIGVISDVHVSDTKIYAYGLLTNPDGIIKSLNGRAYPGVVDCSRMTEEIIGAMLYQNDLRMYAANISLRGMDNEIIKEIYIDKKYYDMWDELAKTGLFGSQSTFVVEKRKYVLLDNCYGNQSGIISIRIARKK